MCHSLSRAEKRRNRGLTNNDTNAVMVVPDNPEAMAKGIIEILGDNNRAKRITEKAYQDVLFHTWDKRASRVLGFLEKM